MIILGAGYIACELGHAYSLFGTQTHFLVRSKLLRLEDAEVQQVFEQEFARRNVIHQSVVPTRVRHDGDLFTVDLKHHSGRCEILKADAFLVATGVSLNFQMLTMRKFQAAN